mmetsp:Transcript_3727/g.13753  ORF Transcript_3727/g.13753 Transcript_3727/m.13753 type:complete len:322 (-) Transcript_3727:456-1421(-)
MPLLRSSLVGGAPAAAGFQPPGVAVDAVSQRKHALRRRRELLPTHRARRRRRREHALDALAAEHVLAAALARVRVHRKLEANRARELLPFLVVLHRTRPRPRIAAGTGARTSAAAASTASLVVAGSGRRGGFRAVETRRTCTANVSRIGVGVFAFFNLAATSSAATRRVDATPPCRRQRLEYRLVFEVNVLVIDGGRVVVPGREVIAIAGAAADAPPRRCRTLRPAKSRPVHVTSACLQPHRSLSRFAAAGRVDTSPGEPPAALDARSASAKPVEHSWPRTCSCQVICRLLGNRHRPASEQAAGGNRPCAGTEARRGSVGR